jgi:hypothetical protein
MKQKNTRKPTATPNGTGARRAVRRPKKYTVAWCLNKALEIIHKETAAYTAKIRAQIPAVERLANTGTPEERRVAKKWLKLLTKEERGEA